MVHDKYVGKVVLVNLPNNKRSRHRWIVKKREDGRYIARTPKLGVLLRDLHKKIEKDFNSEHLLPKNISFWKSASKSKRGPRRVKRLITRKNKLRKKYAV